MDKESSDIYYELQIKVKVKFILEVFFNLFFSEAFCFFLFRLWPSRWIHLSSNTFCRPLKSHLFRLFIQQWWYWVTSYFLFYQILKDFRHRLDFFLHIFWLIIWALLGLAMEKNYPSSQANVMPKCVKKPCLPVGPVRKSCYRRTQKSRLVTRCRSAPG